MSTSIIERPRMRRGAFFPVLFCVLAVLASALRPDGGYAPVPEDRIFGILQAADSDAPDDLKRTDLVRTGHRPDANRDNGASWSGSSNAGTTFFDGPLAILLTPNRLGPVTRGQPTGPAPRTSRGIVHDPRIPTGPPTLV